jgi:hypothetical protein
MPILVEPPVQEPVVIAAIMLSDHVLREAGSNKLSLIGCFSTWNAPMFPFPCPPFFITPFLGNFRMVSGTINVTARIETAVKHVLWSAIAKVDFRAGPQTMAPDALIEIPFQAVGVSFPQAGRYTIRVFVDSDEVAHRDFTVNPVTMPGISRPE